MEHHNFFAYSLITFRADFKTVKELPVIIAVLQYL
jgi:hypothetical protein